MLLFPKNLQKIGSELAIVWENESETYIPLEKLRHACPCALCKGEPDVLGHPGAPLPPALIPASYELISWEIIGSYGFQPKWKDGHGSGIFTWKNLQDIE